MTSEDPCPDTESQMVHWSHSSSGTGDQSRAQSGGKSDEALQRQVNREGFTNWGPGENAVDGHTRNLFRRRGKSETSVWFFLHYICTCKTSRNESK